ncbi:TonB-dependent receptor plug domain-containing protein [Hellea balneolensis]|uniref:TonB-dependent receptor plug domain-containing protein n=1 Tax=Hellea balneolensis TaxID=287478 RepID=UPI00138AAEF9|nr:TonB-dependent receptor [Hellea balneolensis]
MKRFLLGAAIAALLAPNAFGQVQADYEYPLEIWLDKKFEEAERNNEILLIHPPTFDSRQIIVTGSRIGYSNIEGLTVPSSILNVGDIETRGQQYISDLLRTLPGIAVNTSGPGGGLTQIRMRGSEANHVLVLIDGVEVANPSSGEFDFSGLRAEDVVRIETLRGEQSALYGSDAIGGVINIITRAGSIQEGWRASVEAGSRETIEGQISAILPLGGAALSINGNAFNTEGYDISGLGGEDDGSQSRSLNLGLNNVELGGLTLSAKFGTSKLDTQFDSDSDFDGRLNDTNGETTVKTETARVDARFDLAGFSHLITSHMVDTDTDTRGGFSTRSKGARHGINWAAEKEFGDSTFTALAEAEHESYSIVPNFTEADAEPDNWVYALAGDYRYNAGPISFTASARHDINDLFNDATTWRIGGGYAFEDFGGRLRASIGTSVKNPSMIELFGFFPASRFTGNRDLQPEESLGFSLGYEQKLGDLNLSIDYFRSDLKDEITTVFNPDFTSTVINLDTDSTRQGVELEARWSLSDQLSARGSATFLDSDQNDIEEIRRPDFIASATVTYQPIDDLSLTASLDHNGSQLDTDFGTFQNVTLEAFTLVGLNASYNLDDYFTLTLRGDNLLDEDYQEVFGYASPGRAVYAGLKANF